jgi:hypothetical protein
VTVVAADPRAFVRMNHCPKCWYDLTGSSVSARCPECGHERDGLAFALPVVNFRLGRRRRRLQIVAAVGPALVGLLLYQVGVLPLGVFVAFMLIAGLIVTAGFDFWRRWRLMRGHPDAVLLFCTDGLWEQSPAGRHPLPGWRRFHRFRIRRRRRGRWMLKLYQPWWSLSLLRQPGVAMHFRASRREAALVRRRLRRLHAAGAFR